MAQSGPILSLTGARCGDLAGKLDLALQPGELALVDARDLTLAANFADFCCGLVPATEGEVRFLQRDWSQQPMEIADALRGLIGRVLSNPGWLRFLDIETNILLPQLHHTRAHHATLQDEAARLAQHFGLPGLPTGKLSDLSPGDLIRAGLVRAFLGAPKLVILESPLQGVMQDLIPAVLNRLSEMTDRGGAAIWLTRSRMIWDSRHFPATHRLRLNHYGLSRVEMAA
jgi:phospholipid/cholesterol/gamma-HCH transport system ATP-binding protein